MTPLVNYSHILTFQIFVGDGEMQRKFKELDLIFVCLFYLFPPVKKRDQFPVDYSLNKLCRLGESKGLSTPRVLGKGRRNIFCLRQNIKSNTSEVLKEDELSIVTVRCL